MPGQPGKFTALINWLTGTGDVKFLETIFLKLLMNFTWWVNRKDEQGNNIFEGGFLGMDNIGLFDRNTPLPDGSILEQSDSTSWMCMYSLNMMRIALELAKTNPMFIRTWLRNSSNISSISHMPCSPVAIRTRVFGMT